MENKCEFSVELQWKQLISKKNVKGNKNNKNRSIIYKEW